MDNEYIDALTQLFNDGYLGTFVTVYLILLGVLLALSVLYLIAYGKIFKKCGYKFWYTFIPGFSTWVLYEITWGAGPYMFFLFIPFFGEIVPIITMVKLGKYFNKSTGFILGLIFLTPVFLPILAFEKENWS